MLVGIANNVPPLMVIFGLEVSRPKLLSAPKANIPLLIVVPPEYVFTPDRVVIPAPD